MGDERLERLEAGVDALHAPPLVAVGDLPADSPLLVARRLGGQRNVRQAGEEEKRSEGYTIGVKGPQSRYQARSSS